MSKRGLPRTEKIEMSIYRRAKHCNDCGEYKDHSEFNKNPSSRDGFQPWCKACRSIRISARRLEKLKQRRESITIRDCSFCDRPFRFYLSNPKKLCKVCLEKKTKKH